MKSVLVLALAIFSVSASAGDSVSLDYSCVKGNDSEKGSVAISETNIVGKESCMKFGLLNRKLCWRLERPVSVDQIALSLREKSDLNDGLVGNEIIQFRSAPAELSVVGIPVKFGFKTKTVECTFSNVQWPVIPTDPSRP